MTKKYRITWTSTVMNKSGHGDEFDDLEHLMWLVDNWNAKPERPMGILEPYQEDDYRPIGTTYGYEEVPE